MASASKRQDVFGTFDKATGLLTGLLQGNDLPPLLLGAGNDLGVRWGLFGHSFMDQETTSGTGTIESYNAVGTVVWANALLGHPFQIVKCAGIGGYRLLDMLDMYDALVRPLALSGIFVSLGHNDLKGLYPSGNGTAGALYPQLPADSQQTHVTYLAARLRVWLKTVPPSQRVVLLGETPPGQNPAGASAGTSTQLAVRFQQWNRMLRLMASEFGNVIYVPTDRPILLPASANGLNKTLTYFDQVHPSILGAYYRGKMLAAHMARFAPMHADPLPYSAADTHTAAVLTSSAAPSAASGTLTIPLTNGSATLKTIEVGDWINLALGAGVTAADKSLVGRYQVLTATTTAITSACAVTATGSTTMRLSNSRQLFINPLFLTTTGGNAGGFSNLGTIVGTLPLGVDIINLPANWTATFSTEAHTLADGTAGYGNWLKMVLDTGAAGAAGAFDLVFQMSQKSASPGTYDVARKAHYGVPYQAGVEYKQASAAAGYNGAELSLYVRTADIATETAGATVTATAFLRDTTAGLQPNDATAPWPLDNMQIPMVTPEVTFESPAPGLNFMEIFQGRMKFRASGPNVTATIYLARCGGWSCDDAQQPGRISLY